MIGCTDHLRADVALGMRDILFVQAGILFALANMALVRGDTLFVLTDTFVAQATAALLFAGQRAGGRNDGPDLITQTSMGGGSWGVAALGLVRGRD